MLMAIKTLIVLLLAGYLSPTIDSAKVDLISKFCKYFLIILQLSQKCDNEEHTQINNKKLPLSAQKLDLIFNFPFFSRSFLLITDHKSSVKWGFIAHSIYYNLTLYLTTVGV